MASFRRDITALNKITEISDKLKRFIGILYDEISLDEFIGYIGEIILRVNP